METIILASLCVGAAAGVRFRVFVLFPLIFLCFVAVTAWGLAQHQTGWSIVGMIFVGSACLQLGYLAGTVPSFLIVCRQTKPTRTPASGSPVYFIGDHPNSIFR